MISNGLETWILRWRRQNSGTMSWDLPYHLEDQIQNPTIMRNGRNKSTNNPSKPKTLQTSLAEPSQNWTNVYWDCTKEISISRRLSKIYVQIPVGTSAYSLHPSELGLQVIWNTLVKLHSIRQQDCKNVAEFISMIDDVSSEINDPKITMDGAIIIHTLNSLDT